jgi:NAD(P)-dependent dehydrogenase (short-subunit alcohol dehydrogenase family)
MIDAVSIQPEGRLKSSSDRKRVLVTGANGNIGSYFCEHNADRYDLRLMMHEAPDDRARFEKLGEVVIADVTDLDQMKRVCTDIDTVLHLAADPSPHGEWANLLPINIVGTYNTFAAARFRGVKRVIYASSIHAVSGYPADVQIKPSDPVNPGDLYGVSKCFGEALARYMAEQEGLSSIAIRIGGFQPRSEAKKEIGVSMLDAWVSRRDLDQLIRLCIDAEGIRFAIFNGLSDNRFKRLDITNARELLGYAPQDDTTEINPELAPLDLDDRVVAHNLTDPNAKSGVKDQNMEVSKRK